MNCECVNVGGVLVKGIWWAKEWRWMGTEGVVCIYMLVLSLFSRTLW